MSRGRADYWYGMLPGYSGLGISQSDWFINEDIVLGAKSYDNICEYTVPEDYLLYITYGCVSCSKPGLNRCYLSLNDVTGGIMEFDTNLVLPFGVSGTFVLNEGESLRFVVDNLLNEVNHMYGYFLGYEEFKIG